MGSSPGPAEDQVHEGHDGYLTLQLLILTFNRAGDDFFLSHSPEEEVLCGLLPKVSVGK